jgi:hypothetical protein
MGDRWGIRSIGLRILLIALSIQGITPDVHDLTSGALIRILVQILGDSKTDRAGDALPSRDEDENEMPDDVCVAVRQASLVPRHQPGGSPGPDLLASSRPTPLIGRDPPFSTRSRSGIARGRDLVNFRCRLNC